MAGRSVDYNNFIQPDRQGCEIANNWQTWDSLRDEFKNQIKEVRQYVYATDTTKTTNQKLPWKNKTTIPKLCQIRDNLNANYLASIFPKRKNNIVYEPETRDDDTMAKKESITGYMCYATGYKRYKEEIRKCILDYIDTGNAIAAVEWVDERVEVLTPPGNQKTQVGYVGPVPVRINPLDVVVNPIAPSWYLAPKIIRSIVSMGEVKDILQKLSTDEDKEAYQKLWTYMKELRRNFSQAPEDFQVRDNYLNVDGFTDFRSYLGSNYCEILTFYGDIYDPETDEYLKNYKIMVVDRHKVIYKKPNPSWFGYPPIVHVGWRYRQDNLWAMGPLANLVGMQYRLDHIENLKADIFDLITFPPLKIKGYVEDFEWGPFAKIHVDADGDVEPIAPQWNVLQSNEEMRSIMALMEEMAGSPKEAMGFRTPGEKTKYEVQRLENAASRIFQSKIGQFEETFLEEIQNMMLESARRNVTSAMLIKYFDSQDKISVFLDLTPDDLAGQGKVRPWAARHFAEQAEMVQNLTTLSQAPLWQAIAPHFSTIKLANLFEDMFELSQYDMIKPYIALAEQADAQRIANAQAEMVMMEALKDTGLTPDDVTLDPQIQQQSINTVNQILSPTQPQGQPNGFGAGLGQASAGSGRQGKVY